MKTYHICRDGTSSGPFPESEIVRFLAAGEVTAADLCWTEGMDGWEPVSMHFPGTSPEPSPISLPPEPETADAEEGTEADTGGGPDTGQPRIHGASPVPERMPTRPLTDLPAVRAALERQQQLARALRPARDRMRNFETAAGFHFPAARLLPLALCCLVLGWFAAFAMPERLLLGSTPEQVARVLMLAVPALAIAFWAAVHFLRPHAIPVKSGVATLLFTMIVGLAALLAFQRLADHSLTLENRPYGNRYGTLLVVVLKGIGWAYRSLDDPDFLTRLVAMVAGVGFCEEVTKLLPLFGIVLLRRRGGWQPDYRQFLLVGFCSGLGFGIGEALHSYAPWNGNVSATSNVIRWFACVPTHAVYTVINAAFLWVLVPRIQRAEKRSHVVLYFLSATAVVAVVHGLYNSISGLAPLLGPAMDLASFVLMYVFVNVAAMNARGPGKEGAGDLWQRLRLPATVHRRLTPKPMFGAAGALIFLALVGSHALPDPALNDTGGSGTHQAVAPKQSANRAAFELYMQGYNDPRQGEVAALLAERAWGEDLKGYALMALGAEDRKNGRPVRFQVDE